MAENMVRCPGCHEVYDANLGACTKCGLPYKPPTPKPELYDGLYSDRYAADDLPPLDPSVLPAVTPSRRRNNTGLLMGAGIAVIVSALVIGSLFAFGAFGGSAPTPTPARIISATAAPSPTATLPPAVQKTIDFISDPNLSAKLTIASHVQVFAGVAGQAPMNATIKFDGQVSNGNQWGTFTENGISQEVRLIEGQVYRRFLPAGKWQTLAGMSSYMVICPLFGITKTRDLQLIKQETKDGREMNHLQSTRFYSPSYSRMALKDLSVLVIGPDVEILDLWTTLDGVPISATFSGTKTTGDGTKLVDIQVSYTFDNVGVVRTIDIPGPRWSPSPTFQS
jgi:hypothetical protein